MGNISFLTHINDISRVSILLHGEVIKTNEDFFFLKFITKWRSVISNLQLHQKFLDNSKNRGSSSDTEGFTRSNLNNLYKSLNTNHAKYRSPILIH